MISYDITKYFCSNFKDALEDATRFTNRSFMVGNSAYNQDINHNLETYSSKNDSLVSHRSTVFQLTSTVLL